MTTPDHTQPSESNGEDCLAMFGEAIAAIADLRERKHAVAQTLAELRAAWRAAHENEDPAHEDQTPEIQEALEQHRAADAALARWLERRHILRKQLEPALTAALGPTGASGPGDTIARPPIQTVGQTSGG